MLFCLNVFQLSFQHKVGVLYCKAGQSTEEEMYNNESAGPALDEFLDLLGQRVRLKGFNNYKAQLDNKSMCTKHIYICLFSLHVLMLFAMLYAIMYSLLSVITFKPLRDDMKNIDYLITVPPVKGWDTLGSM